MKPANFKVFHPTNLRKLIFISNMEIFLPLERELATQLNMN